MNDETENKSAVLEATSEVQNMNDENKPDVLEANLTNEVTNINDDTENKQPDALEVTSEVLNCLSESDDEFLEPNQFLPGEGLYRKIINLEFIFSKIVK